MPGVDGGGSGVAQPGAPVRVLAAPAALDAFARQRMSMPQTIFDSKQIFDNAPAFWDDQQVSGAGTGSVYSMVNASSTLSVSGAVAGRRIRQTFMCFNYQPGKSQLVTMTGALRKSGGGAGVRTYIGQGDDNNGFFFFCDDGTVKVLIRTQSLAGDQDESQAAWSLNRGDGNGDLADPSVNKILIDWSKENIFVFDYEWLGVGKVRFGVFIDGAPIYLHAFSNANKLDSVYLTTPNLPLRYEIENLGAGVASTLDHICSTVISEGGIQELGSKHYQSTQLDVVSGGILKIDGNTAGTVYVLAGLRLQAGMLGGTVDSLEIAILVSTNDDYEWGLSFNPGINNPGSVTWTPQSKSTVEYARGDVVGNPSITTLSSMGDKIDGGLIKGSSQGGDLARTIASARRLGSTIGGTPDELILWVRPHGANADFTGSMSWRESN